MILQDVVHAVAAASIVDRHGTSNDTRKLLPTKTYVEQIPVD
jgi:hypothetical protein